jgi:hypothetical protein
MLKRLTRKLLTLSVLVVALTAVFAAPTRARAEPTCWVCVCEGSRCECVQVVCPQ